MATALGFKVDGDVFDVSLLPAQPAVVREARVFQLLGTDMLSSVKNWTGNANTSVVGSPVYSAGYAGLDGLDGFQSADPAGNGEFTYLAISTGNNVSTGNLGIMGRWQSGSNQDLLYFFNNNSVAVGIDGLLRSSILIPGTLPAAKLLFRLMGARYDGATARALLSDAGVITHSDAAYVGGASTSAPLRIGATNFPNSAGGNVDVAAAIGWNYALTDQEIEDVYTYLKGLITARGGFVE
jgi:hypothetical protein